MTKCVAVYCRISRDKQGNVEGVRNQERWGREYAAKMWPGLPVRVFADNDISASNGDHRPEFEALRAAITNGEVAHVWAVEQSRLERREVGWFELAAELDAAGIPDLHTDRDGIVRVRDEVAGIKAVLNAAEIRKLKRRLNDRLAANAEKGTPAGSTPFGYRHGVNEKGVKTLLIVDDQAQIIRECADRILAGWSISSIVKDLHGRGVHGPHQVKVKDADGNVVTEDGTPEEDGGKAKRRASTVTSSGVRKWVTNATVAGRRIYRGKDVGAGNWQGILDGPTWRAVSERLSSPRIVKQTDGFTYPIRPGARATGRRYLLTGGIARCGVCDSPLIATMKQMKRGRQPSVPYYLCHPNRGGKGCVGIMADRFEEHVADRLFEKLDEPDFVAALNTDAYATRRVEIQNGIDDVKRQQKMIVRRLREGLLSEDVVDDDLRDLAAEEVRLKAEMGSLPPTPSKDKTEEFWRTLHKDWEDFTLDERREVVSTCIRSVAVNRAIPGTRAFDHRRIAEPEWVPTAR